MGMTGEDIRELLRAADESEFHALERSLAADERKGVRAALEVARKRIQAERAEATRLNGLYAYERSLVAEGLAGPIVGLDEVGRGPVAGPLAVGAVVFENGAEPLAGLNDSKQIAAERRAAIAEEVKRTARAWAVCYVQPEEIDRDGMARSLRRAFDQALRQVLDEIGEQPALVLVDGNPLHIHEREVNVVKGDARCASIAAASVIAKVDRDAMMVELAARYPQYGFDANKGYASAEHVDAIRSHGLCPAHRASFCKSFLQETLF